MYGIRTFRLLAAWSLVAAWSLPLQAGPAEDQYAVAAAHYTRTRWQLAAEEFEAFVDSFPDHQRADTAVFFLAEALIQLGQFEEAHGRFQEFLRRAPEHRYAQRALFRTGETAYLDDSFAEAKRQLKQFLERYPDDALNAYTLTYLGEIALADGNAEGAQQAYADALKGYPDGPLANECRFGMARALELQSDTAGALRFYRFLAEQRRSPLADQAQLHIGILQYKQGDYAEAQRALEHFAATFPESKWGTHAAYWLGMTQLAQRQWEASSKTLTQAGPDETGHPLSAAIEFAAGEAQRHKGELQTAAEHYDRVLASWPDSPWADDALQAAIQVALSLSQHERIDELASRFDRDFEDDPLRPLVRQIVGRSLLKRERYETAITVFEQLTAERDPATPAPDSDTDNSPAPETPAPGTPDADKPAVAESNLYFLALAYLGADRHEESLATLQRIDVARQSKELVDGVAVARASALMALERYESALVPLRAYLDSQADGADTNKCRAQLVVALAHVDRLDEASEAYEAFRAGGSEHPLFLPTTLYLAETAYAAGRRELAERLYEDLAREENPAEYAAKGLSGMAWTQFNGRQADQAAETFQQLLQRYPESPLAAEAALVRGRALVQLDKLDDALAAYQLVGDKYPQSKQAPAALLAAAQLHERLERDQEALALLERITTAYPDYKDLDVVLYQRAWVLVDLQRPAEADEIFRRLATQYSDSRFWADATYRLAERAARAERRERAEQLSDELIRSECPPDVLCHALYLKGQLAAAAGRWQDVASAMRRVTEEFPQSGVRLPAEYWLAEATYRLERYEEAGKQFAALARRTDGRRDSWLAMIPLRRAQVLAHQKRWAEAHDMARDVVAKFPNFRQQYEVDYVLGRCLSSQARFDEARDAFGRVTGSPHGARTETAAMAQWMIGETQFHQKRYDEAIKAYHRVEALHAFPRWQAGALLQAGKCHELESRWKQAIKLYVQIIKEYPDTPFTEEASSRLRVARQRASVAQKP